MSQNSNNWKLKIKKPALKSLSNTVKDLLDVMLETLLKKDNHTGISEPTVCRCSAK